MNEISDMEFLDRLHQNAALSTHLEILYGNSKISGVPFLPLYRECMTKSDTKVPGWKVFSRPQRALTIARYFHHSLSLAGSRAECGVYRGFSALLLAHVARSRDPDFDGADFHIFDSFEGLSSPTSQDAVGARDMPDRAKEPIYSHAAGHFATPDVHVRRVLGDFPNIAIHKGWIPETFAPLPETGWAFVHIDVDLYEPTKACLEYFYPRLAPGGVIVNDDYVAPMFPGCGRAWRDFFESCALSYVVLDTGQAVFMNPRR